MVLFFSILLFVINIILWVFFLRIMKKSFSAKGLLGDIKQEAEKIIIEINRETDSAITLMEAKINQVKEIIDIAEKKIILYENTLIQKENEKKLYQQLSEFQQKSNPVQKAVKKYESNSSTSDQDFLPLFTENAGTSDFKTLKNNSEIKQKSEKNNFQNLELDFSEKKEKSNELNILQGEKIEPKIPVKEQIIKLAKEGFTPELIAKKLNVSVSVVTMTIDLYL